jgi:hypothetical protein
VRSRQLALDINGDIPDGPIPVVYLACRLTGLTGDQRKLLDSWCTHIEQVVTETAAESEDKWDVAVHIPFTWSAPWSDRRPPEKIYEVNSTTVSGSAAVIILSIDGGGLGVGQEFAWATALRLPILVVHPVDQPPSRQTIGTPADVTVAPFANANELAEAVRSFLRANRSVIEDWHRRTKSQTMALTPLRETLAEKWHAMGSRDRERVQAESRARATDHPARRRSPGPRHGVDVGSARPLRCARHRHREHPADANPARSEPPSTQRARSRGGRVRMGWLRRPRPRDTRSSGACPRWNASPEPRDASRLGALPQPDRPRCLTSPTTLRPGCSTESGSPQTHPSTSRSSLAGWVSTRSRPQR